MKPEAQRMAIARLHLGYEDFDWLADEDYPNEPRKLYGAKPKVHGWRPVPNYLNDLNAIHEALRFICKKKRLRAFCNIDLDGSWECVLTESSEPNCIPCDGDYFGCGDTLAIAMAKVFLDAAGKGVEK